MKRLIVILVSIFTVIALGLICLMVVAVNRGSMWTMNSFFNLELVNEQTASLNGIDQLYIDYHADDVEFFTSDTDQLVLKEYMSFTPDKDQLTHISQSGSKMKLEGRIRDDINWFFHVNHGSRMEIYLPAEYQGALNTSTSSGNITSSLVLTLSEVQLSATSGNIEMNELTADQLEFTTSSGNITVSKAEGNRQFSAHSGEIEVYGGAGDTTVSTSSGNITIENSLGELEAKTSSGNIRIAESSGEKKLDTTSGNIDVKESDGYTKASASSGNITLSDHAGAGDFKTHSGELELDFTEVSDSITVDASSGNADITLPSSLQFNFNADTSSGTIRTYFDEKLDFNKNGDHADGTIGSSPSFNLQITTTSGNIDVNER